MQMHLIIALTVCHNSGEGNSAECRITHPEPAHIVRFWKPVCPCSHPARDSAQRCHLQKWLNFISRELHKSIGPLFSPVLSDDVKTFFKERATGKFRFVDGKPAGQGYLMGKRFTVADGYPYVILRWPKVMKFDLSRLSNLLAKDRVAARPKVQEALLKEGLVKAA
jgi:glutathione S-transferase